MYLRRIDRWMDGTMNLRISRMSLLFDILKMTS